MTGDLPRAFGPDYTLLKLLARGGMGEIYLARTSGITGFEKYYAVKKLLKKFTHDNDVGARFVDEAKLGARLQHPNIVQVFDLGRVNDELYMATEFVDGFDLRRVLRFCHDKKKRIPLDIALFIVREVLSGLAYAHRQLDAEGRSINLIHRDISPQNVLVSFEGEVKIIDFGLAKSTQRSQETQANVLLGNFGYMSPEQARGLLLDFRTDVYSAGIVLFELVTGTKRFVEENPLRLLEMVARPTPIMPSDRVTGIPRAIDRIYAKATAPAKEERYEHAEAFRDEVTAALHRVNTKASRENLAQFLSHLFLGGVAPPPVDSGLLDKSVAIRVRDLHEGNAAFQRTAEHDVGDRRLQEFDDDAPQTASHTVMRTARIGDVLTHEALTGIAASVQPLAAPPAAAEELLGSVRAASPASAPTTRGPTVASTGDVPAPFVAPASTAASALAAAAPLGNEQAMPEPLPAAELPPTLPDIGPDLLSVAEDSPLAPSPLDFIVDVAPAPVADPRASPVDHVPDHDSDHDSDHDRFVEGPSDEPTQPGVMFPAPPPPPPPRPRTPRTSHGQAQVVSTVAAGPMRPEPALEEPSIVVSMDIEAEEPTVVGAMPSPRARADERADTADEDSGFGEEVHESLIIDFEGEPEPEPPASSSIRPAAKPLGKRVESMVAQPSARPRPDGSSTSRSEDGDPHGARGGGLGRKR